ADQYDTKRSNAPHAVLPPSSRGSTPDTLLSASERLSVRAPARNCELSTPTDLAIEPPKCQICVRHFEVSRKEPTGAPGVRLRGNRIGQAIVAAPLDELR